MKLQKAKKEHICSLCGEKIPIGDHYWRHYEELDHYIIDNKEHTNCESYKSKHITARESDSAED